MSLTRFLAFLPLVLSAALTASTVTAQDDVVGKFAYIKTYRTRLTADGKEVGQIPWSMWLPIEQTNGTHYRVTYKAGKAEPVKGWIRREDAALEPKYPTTVWPELKKYSQDLAEGTKLIRAGKFAEGGQIFDAALRWSQQTFGAEHANGSIALRDQALALFYAARYEQAVKLQRESLRIREKALGGNHPATAETLRQLSEMLRHQGEFREAETAGLRSVAIQEAAIGKDSKETALCLMVMGELYRVMGHYDRAIPILERALRICDATYGANDIQTFEAVLVLGARYHDVQRYADAERLYLRALKIIETKFGKDHYQYGRSLGYLAKTQHALGRLAEAEANYRVSLAAFEKERGKDHPYTSLIRGFFSALYMQQGRYAEAEPLMVATYEAMKVKLGINHDCTNRAHNALAGLYAVTNRPDQARAAYDDTRREMRRLVTDLLPTLTQEQQTQYLRVHYVSSLADALSFGLHRGNADAKTTESAALWLANGKAVQQEAQALATQLQAVDNPQARPVAERLKTIREKVTRTKMDARELDAAAKRDLEQLETQERELTQQLQRLGGRTGRGSRWTELAAIRAALPEKGVLIDFVRLDYRPPTKGATASARYVAWITPRVGAVQMVDLGDAAAIDALVGEYQRELLASAESVSKTGEQQAEEKARAKGRKLAEKILDPLLAVSSVSAAEHWILSPDGGLWLAPWAALPTSNNKFLVERCVLRTVSAGRDLVASGEQTAVKKTAPILLSNPAFDLSRAAAAKKLRETTGRAVEERGGNSLSAALQLGRIARLPGTAAEAQLIAPKVQTLTKQTPRSLAGEETLEGVVKTIRHPQLLVLATHGFFLPEQRVKRDERFDVAESRSAIVTTEGKLYEDPLLRCGLLLAACNDQPKAGETRPGDDGVLTGLEVVGMDLRGCELVVLSACETGRGDVRSGEGVAGLRQAFQLAGAESVAASLWMVPDTETALLMNGFFDSLSSGTGRSAALAQAQRAQIERRREKFGAAHPFYWAAFTLTGQDSSKHASR